MAPVRSNITEAVRLAFSGVFAEARERMAAKIQASALAAWLYSLVATLSVKRSEYAARWRATRSPIALLGYLAASGIIGGVMVLAGIIILILVLYLVVADLGNVLPSNLLTSSQQSALQNLVGQSTGTIQLLEVLTLVIAAGLIIGGFFAFMGGFGGGRGR